MKHAWILTLLLAVGAASARDINPASATARGDSVGAATFGDGRRDGPIYDTLWIVDDHTYDAGNGNAWSGAGLFGFIYDLQLADDFTTTSDNVFCWVTADYLCFFGGTPANGLQVDVWTDTGAGPGSLVASQTVPVSWASSWSDPIFGLAGRRLGGSVNIALAANTDYYIMIQPIDLSSGGDWYYQVRDLDSFIGGDSYGRDGGRGAGGYGTTAWTGMGEFGFGVGDVSMRIGIPAPCALALLGVWAVAAGYRRR